VPGHESRTTGQNVIQLAREAWAPGQDMADAEWWAHRKDFFAAVLGASVARLESGMSRDTGVALAKALLTALRGKHLLVYVKHEEAAALLAELGWDGRIRLEEGDYLMVVDTNVGFNKVNGIVEQQLEYAVDLRDPTRPRSTLTIAHHNPAPPDGECWHESRYDPTYQQMMERCFWDYLRVYVPEGSELIAATPHSVDEAFLMSGQPGPTGATWAAPESGRAVLEMLLLVRKGEHVETRIDLLLPETVVQPRPDGGRQYSLTVQKQPGTRAVPLSVSITLPPGATRTSSEPTPASQEGAIVSYELALETDQTISVVFQ